MRALVVGLLLAAAPAAAAQVALPVSPDGAPGGAALPTVSVLTMGQGDQIWERFGHNFLVVDDPARGAVAYNWGVFDFAAPDFLSRFLLGDTRYWMEASDLALVLQFYPRTNRSMTIQRLRLTPDETRRLTEFLDWNAREENRFYRYDYFRDNCSTRLRDALDRAMGGALRRALEVRPTNVTYRSESVRLTDEDPAAQTGIALALGQPADQPLSAWEASFVPMRLQQYLRTIEVRDGAGRVVPLVAEERVLFQAQREPERQVAPGLAGRLAVPGFLAAGLIVLAGRLALGGRRGGRTGLAAAAVTWGLVAGAVGTVLVLAWLATRHVFWYRNENLFHFNPLALALVPLVPLALRNARWWRATRTVALLVAGLSVAGGAFKFLPWFHQQNWSFVLLALPINVALAWAVFTLSRRELAEPADRRASAAGGRRRGEG